MKKSGNRSLAGNITLLAFLIVLALVFLFPVIFMINNAFKPLYELVKFPPDIFVRNPTMNNFKDIGTITSKSIVPFTRYMFNTLFILVLGTGGQMLLASMCAFPLAKYDFFGNRFISKLIVMALMFSPAVTAVPNYMILSQLGLINSYGAVIFPAFASTLGLFLMTNFMAQVPSSLIESANLDGANEFVTLFKVVLPSVKPALITLFILSFQSLWGVTGAMFLYDEPLKPVSYMLGQISSLGIARQGTMAAVSLIMFVIPVVIYIFMQTNVIETMTTSGMKD